VKSRGQLGPGSRAAGIGWFDGLLGCLKPMWMILGKNKPMEPGKGKDTIFV